MHEAAAYQHKLTQQHTQSFDFFWKQTFFCLILSFFIWNWKIITEIWKNTIERFAICVINKNSVEGLFFFYIIIVIIAAVLKVATGHVN